MSDNIIHGRNGQRIPIAEYPPGYMDDLNDRLNGIAGTEDAPAEPFLDRAADWVFEKVADGPGLSVVLAIAALAFTGVVVTQVSRWLA